MISIGFQFDYELNSKNHSKKITKILDVVWILFGFFLDCFSICFGFLFGFFDFFGLFFRFFDFF